MKRRHIKVNVNSACTKIRFYRRDRIGVLEESYIVQMPREQWDTLLAAIAARQPGQREFYSGFSDHDIEAMGLQLEKL